MTTPDDVLRAARRIANAADYGFLTSVAGGIQTRLVQHLEVTEFCDITFSTGPATRKAASVRSDPAVSYAVYDRETLAAATVYGGARINHDLDRRLAMWDDSLAPFFPDGPESDGFVLIEIAANRIEVWSIPDELAPPPFGLSSAVTERIDGAWFDVMGTHPSAGEPGRELSDELRAMRDDERY